jgi:hypothetical protein
MRVSRQRVAAQAALGCFLSFTASACTEEGVGGHAEERELLDATAFTEVEAVVRTENHRDEVERVLRVAPDFSVARSVTPPPGWEYAGADLWSGWQGDDGQVHSFEGTGPSDQYSDCDIFIITRPDDPLVEVHANCVRTA